MYKKKSSLYFNKKDFNRKITSHMNTFLSSPSFLHWKLRNINKINMMCDVCLEYMWDFYIKNKIQILYIDI